MTWIILFTEHLNCTLLILILANFYSSFMGIKFYINHTILRIVYLIGPLILFDTRVKINNCFLCISRYIIQLEDGVISLPRQWSFEVIHSIFRVTCFSLPKQDILKISVFSNGAMPLLLLMDIVLFIVRYEQLHWIWE